MTTRRPPRSTAASTYKALSRLAWVSAAIGGLGALGSWFMFAGWFNLLAEIGIIMGGIMFLGSAGLALYWAHKSKRIGRDFGERQVLLAIQQRGGKITAAELASETGMTLADCDKWLKKLSDEGHAELEVTKKGIILYVVPGFVPEEDRKQSQGPLNDPIDELEDILNQLERDPKVPPPIPDLPERE